MRQSHRAFHLLKQTSPCFDGFVRESAPSAHPDHQYKRNSQEQSINDKHTLQEAILSQIDYLPFQELASAVLHTSKRERDSFVISQTSFADVPGYLHSSLRP